MSDPFPLDVDLLRRVLDYVNLGVYITDRDRRIVLWNRKATEITGYREADLVGKACREDILSHVDKDGHRLCSTRLCPLFRAMEVDRESAEPVLVYAKCADGRRVAVATSVAPLHDGAGHVIGGIETFRDETGRIRNLESAKRIQRHLMPESLPEVGPIRFDVLYYPHDLIGGDFYDILPLSDGRYGFMVADVMGHGVSAALYTMWLKSLGQSLIDRAHDPAAFMTALNHQLCRFVIEGSFATAFYGVVDTTTCEVTYANGGHPPPLHYQAGPGRVTELAGGDLPLGVADDEAYQCAAVALEPGDLLLGFTDGVAEVDDRDGNMLGPAGLAALLTHEAPRPPQGRLERIYRQVLETCRDVSLSDDVLLLSVAREP